MSIEEFYLDLMPSSFSLGTSGFAQIQQDLASGGLRAWHFGLSHRIDFDPAGPYGRKMLFASIVKPSREVSAPVMVFLVIGV